MSLDHLCEEGLAEIENFNIPFSIAFLGFVFLTLPHILHFKNYFHIFWRRFNFYNGIFKVWKTSFNTLDILYATLSLIWNTKSTGRPLDATKSRD